MSTVKLVRPTHDLKDAYLDFYQEWKNSGETMVPWVISKDPTDFEGMLNFLFNNERGKNLPQGWVSESTYWLVAEPEDRVVGVVNIRHDLTEKLYNEGGHIGYGIRPSERRKGYATQILALALQKTEDLGITKVLVVCDEENIASAKTILKNGGIPTRDFIEEDGHTIKLFGLKMKRKIKNRLRFILG